MFLTIGKAVKRMDIFMRFQTIISFPKMIRKKSAVGNLLNMLDSDGKFIGGGSSYNSTPS